MIDDTWFTKQEMNEDNREGGREKISMQVTGYNHSGKAN
jgi:hypothetical protein